jgi:hypothetical protein
VYVNFFHNTGLSTHSNICLKTCQMSEHVWQCTYMYQTKK